MRDEHIILSVVSVMIVALTLAISVRCVPVGHEGVLKRFGEVKHEKTLGEGWHLVMPVVTSVESITKKLVKVDVKANSASKDLQIVSTVVTVQFSLENVSNMIQKVGNLSGISQIIMFPAVQESVKSVTAQYTAEDLIKQRSLVKVGIEKSLTEFIKLTLKNKELEDNSIYVANVALTDFDFSDEFNASIEAKVKAEQDALRAKNEKMKKITEAEATATKIKLESIARARAIKREAEALRANPLLIEYKKMEKWDGILPKITSGVIPLIDAEKSIQ